MQKRTQASKPCPFLHIFKNEATNMKKLDNIDRKIIQILQKNARTPLKEIAAQVFLSSPSVSARIEKLEEEGVSLSTLLLLIQHLINQSLILQIL